MGDKIEEAVQELMRENGMSRTNALFVLWREVGLRYLKPFQGEDGFDAIIKSALAALEAEMLDA
jgi:hypothetical protein